MLTAQRRICQPTFDCTCLEGGCGYCNMSPWRNVDTIYNDIGRDKGHAVNRGDGTPGDLYASFRYGERHNWGNANSRIKETR